MQDDLTSKVTRANDAKAGQSKLLEAIDIAELWDACVLLVKEALPCYSCSLILDVQERSTQRAYHYSIENKHGQLLSQDSSDIATSYLIANPQICFYAYSQIKIDPPNRPCNSVSNAIERHEFIHLAFRDAAALESILSIRIVGGKTALSGCGLAFLNELYPMLDTGLRRIRRLEVERAKQRAIEASFDRLALLAVVVDQHMKPLYLTPSARKLCRAWGGAEELPEQVCMALKNLMCAQENGPAQVAGQTLAIKHRSQPERILHIEIERPLQIAEGHRHYILRFTEDNGLGESPAQTPRATSLLQQLSPSERKVANLIFHGLRNDAVAEQLCRSRKTIETHISSIYRKLEIRSRSQLVRLFSQQLT